MPIKSGYAVWFIIVSSFLSFKRGKLN